MTAAGMNNVVLTPKQIASLATDATEIGIAGYRPNAKWCGLEFRGNATAVFQLICHTESGTASATTMQARTSGDNGATWTGFVKFLTADETAWV
jgi:hypothetical protein